MSTELTQAREQFTQGISRIANFWGLPRASGAMYAAIYLSPEPITLDELVEQVGISKGAVSTNVRSLERLGMIHKQFKVGDRKDYYIAETDFWKIVKGILREREKSEFDLALRTVGESLDTVKKAKSESPELADFYQERIKGMKKFYDDNYSKINKVLECYKDAIDINPMNPWTVYDYACELSWWSQANKDLEKEAVKHLIDVLKIDPDLKYWAKEEEYIKPIIRNDIVKKYLR